MTQRVLITGGAGFIGSHVADLFLDRGYEVEIIDNISTGKRENVPERATLHEISVTSPEAAAVVRDGRFDVLVHLAAQMDVRRSVEDPMFDATTNILGIVNLLEAVNKSERATRVVFTSTGGAIYGDFNKPPNVETFSKDPDSPYAISKLSSEYYLAYYGRQHGLEHVSPAYASKPSDSISSIPNARMFSCRTTCRISTLLRCFRASPGARPPSSSGR